MNIKLKLMDFSPTTKMALGLFAFAVFWVLAVFPTVPFLPFGRTAGSLIGAVLMVVLGVLTPDQAYAAIDLPILGLLFGTMLLGVYLERADLFKYLARLLSWNCRGAKDMLCRICVVSAISSALFTNDTSCIVLSEFVLEMAWRQSVPPLPFLLALASSANIGSSATPIGNPQNLIIALQSHIPFWDFLMGLFPAMLLGAVINALILLCMFWRLLSVVQVTPDSSATAPHLKSLNYEDWKETLMERGVWNREVNYPSSSVERIGLEEENGDGSNRWKRVAWKSSVYLVTIAMMVALLMGLNMSFTALTAAFALVVIDFRDARPSLEKVSYSLLLFFCGMFVTVNGFSGTGIPSALWMLAQPYARIDDVAGVTVLALIILLLSNVCSNVPTVLLLGAKVADSAGREGKKAWLILAWVSTVAGNFTLLGSAANLIVCEKARCAQFFSYNLTFWRHLKFGVPSTLLVTAVGLALIKG